MNMFPFNYFKKRLADFHAAAVIAFLACLLCSCGGIDTTGPGPIGGVVGSTLTFGLPSVGYYENACFTDGKKSRMSSQSMQAFVTNFGGYGTTKISVIQKWKIHYNEMDDEYTLYNIDGEGKYSITLCHHNKPEIEMLRHIFGRYIIFPGDDMTRVRTVHDDTWKNEDLVLNDGRVPADTFRPDDWPR